MKGILSDNNISGHVHVLMTILEGEVWRDLWTPVQLQLLDFADLGLAPDVSDSVLWQTCQREGVLLITANRNKAGPDSLEATIQAQTASDSLPVFTIGNPDKVLQSRDYAERAAAQLLDYLMNIDLVRGAGRLYLP